LAIHGAAIFWLHRPTLAAWLFVLVAFVVVGLAAPKLVAL
jgi:hypothetical protein